VRVLLLTTDTPHHAKFAQSLVLHADVLVVDERQAMRRPHFYTASEVLASLQKNYEQARWFNHSEVRLRDVCNVVEVQSVNDTNFDEIATEFRYDLTLVFGTSILSRETIRRVASPILNFHGGDPQHYRGLDSHLWCAYHADREALKVALHVLEPTIDTGPLVSLERVKIESGSRIEHLRAFTTELCISMTLDAMPQLFDQLRSSSLKSYPKGRYYSHMPALLLDRSRKNYSRWSTEE
jgi:folate-dependent phosphoribosylglycinamide formyltransferase PurN